MRVGPDTAPEPLPEEEETPASTLAPSHQGLWGFPAFRTMSKAHPQALYTTQPQVLFDSQGKRPQRQARGGEPFLSKGHVDIYNIIPGPHTSAS